MHAQRMFARMLTLSLSAALTLLAAAAPARAELPPPLETPTDTVVTAEETEREAPSLRERLRGIDAHSHVATALYISAFVHLAGTLAGLIGAIPVAFRSHSGGNAMVGASIASFVGHIVTVSFAIDLDMRSGALRRVFMDDLLREHAAPSGERAARSSALVEALF